MHFRAIDGWLIAAVVLYTLDHWVGGTACLVFVCWAVS